MELLLPQRTALQRSLRAAAAWFSGMVDPATQRLHYSYSVAHARHEDQRCPIRDIGTAADLAVLSAASGSCEFDQVSLTVHAAHAPLRRLRTWKHMDGSFYAVAAASRLCGSRFHGLLVLSRLGASWSASCR